MELPKLRGLESSTIQAVIPARLTAVLVSSVTADLNNLNYPKQTVLSEPKSSECTSIGETQMVVRKPSPLQWVLPSSAENSGFHTSGPFSEWLGTSCPGVFKGGCC